MFTVETKINGVKIGEIYCRNLNQPKEGKDSYYYEYHRYEREVIKGFVTHYRENGIELLISMIHDDINDRLIRS